MLLHCTKRLAEKIPHGHFSNLASAASPDEPAPLGEWHKHLLLLDRRQCVMFCHDLTRYGPFLPGLRAPHFLATLAAQGIPSFPPGTAQTHLQSNPNRRQSLIVFTVASIMRAVLSKLHSDLDMFPPIITLLAFRPAKIKERLLAVTRCVVNVCTITIGRSFYFR